MRIMHLSTELLSLVSIGLDVTALATMCLVNRELHGVFAKVGRSRQASMLSSLDEAEGGGRWAWIHPPALKCFFECDKTRGTLVRLMVRDGGSSVFRGVASFEEFDPCLHLTYLLRDEEVRIRWVGEGLSFGRAWLDGKVRERGALYSANYFANRAHSESDSESEESE